MANNENRGDNKRMPLSVKNYKLMLIGAAIIVLGFILMSGGGDHTSTHFDESIYSVRRITIAPIVVIAGFVFEIYAIMKRFPESDNK
jgi:hypothetical protein